MPVVATKIARSSIADTLDSGPVTLPASAVRNAVFSAIAWNVQNVSTDTTLTASSEYVRAASPAGGSLALTLPAAASCPGIELVLKNVGGGSVVLSCQGADLVDGEASLTLAGANQAIRILSTGTGWDIVGAAFGPATYG